MKDPVCKECVYFLQHYVFTDGWIHRVHCGHCTQKQVKSKNPDTPACKHFLPGETEEDKLVGKQYLTKRLLESVLRLDLAPEFMDASREELQKIQQADTTASPEK